MLDIFKVSNKDTSAKMPNKKEFFTKIDRYNWFGSSS